MFNTHCGMAFLEPKNLGIQPFMPDPDPTATILSKLVRTHRNNFYLFNEYHAVNWACKKVTDQFILEKYHKSLSIQIVGFAKVISLQILTHLITEYAELEDNNIQEIDWKMKDSISGETIFEEFTGKIDWNQEAFAVQNLCTLAQIVSMAYKTSKNAGYIKMIFRNGTKYQGLRRPGATSSLTSQERLRKPEYH